MGFLLNLLIVIIIIIVLIIVLPAPILHIIWLEISKLLAWIAKIIANKLAAASS
ncbi:MAG: hypothetical protein QW045_02905 [Candidatus Micrarchaeaceae archaeon]